MNNPDIEFVAANDLTDTKTLAHLLKYDSTLGPLARRCEARRGLHHGRRQDDQDLRHQRSRRRSIGRRSASQVVVESTGHFTDATKAKAHLRGSVKKVIISAPATNEDVTIVLGVNDDKYDAVEAQHDFERFVHDELSRSGGESSA